MDLLSPIALIRHQINWSFFVQAVFTRYNESAGYKINKPLSGLLVCRLVLGWEIVLKTSHLPSKLCFLAKFSFFKQSLSRGHYQPIYQPPEGGLFTIQFTYIHLFMHIRNIYRVKRINVNFHCPSRGCFGQPKYKTKFIWTPHCICSYILHFVLQRTDSVTWMIRRSPAGLLSTVVCRMLKFCQEQTFWVWDRFYSGTSSPNVLTLRHKYTMLSLTTQKWQCYCNIGTPVFKRCDRTP